ncbi:MAG TPA: hypothetical protein VEV20_13540 [Burkholderiales bacterium]|nr:hypothetical protein [Burkholderiales bacterium]
MANPQSSSVWLPGVVLLVVAGTSYLVHETAYQTSRPVETKTRSKELLIPEDVDARLWQDPLYALDQHLKGEESAKGSDVTEEHHKAAVLKQEIEERLERLAPAPDGKGSRKTEADSAPDADQTDGSQPPQDFTLLAVMVPKAPYAEPAERRRRIRYAVLSGLSRAGLVPEDQEHISFFTHYTVDAAQEKRPEYITYEFMRRSASPRPKLKNDATARSKVVGPVVVLWIPTEGSQRCVQPWLASIFGAVAPSQDTRLKFAVLGPPESGTLTEMVREAITPPSCERIPVEQRFPWLAKRMQFYSPWASAAGNELAYSLQDDLNRRRSKLKGSFEEVLAPCMLKADPAQPVQECRIEKILNLPQPDSVLPPRKAAHPSAPAPQPVRLVRLIADDVLLSNALLEELARRGVNPACAWNFPSGTDNCFDGGQNRHRIAIVSEWDAPYQRALRWTLGRTIRERCGRQYQHGQPCTPPPFKDSWLVPFSYLRGLDGQIADAPDASIKREDDSKHKSADPSQPFGEVDTVERADGNAQFDYIRRLVEQIESKDRQLQEDGKSAIGAIGVLGTDPYDKLTILQALHDRFADKIFFTTNLDARLIHPRESQWARNLIVVSAFDLQLDQELQRDIPPLRDGYQTAAYFATIFAMRDQDFDRSSDEVRNLRCRAMEAYGYRCDGNSDVTVKAARSWFTPLVFEVGRTRAVRLEQVLSDRNGPKCDRWEFQCIDVQPDVEPTAPHMRASVLPVASIATFLAIVLAGMLFVQAAKPRPLVSTETAYRILHRRVALVAVLGLLGAGLALSWNAAWTFLTENGMGEPGLIFEGVSIWPAQAIRLLIIALAIAFMFRSHKRLSANCKDIMKRFQLPGVSQPGVGPPPRNSSLGVIVRRQIEHRIKASWKCVKKTCSMRPPVDPHDVQSLWAHYLQDGRACARLCRVFFFGLLYTALSLVAFEIWPDIARFRGERSYAINHYIFMASVLSFNLLLFYVVDALIICNRCVKRLNIGLDWPQPSYTKFKRDLGEGTPLKEWMTVQFIASRTDAVGALVYLPFILLFLIIIARNSVFGHWNLTPSVVALLCVSAAIVIVAGLRLRGTTEAARSAALASLTDQLIVAKGIPNDTLVRQLELIINEVKELRQGAFAPYTDQKFIRALLLPLAGLASTALIEYMSLVKP